MWCSWMATKIGRRNCLSQERKEFHEVPFAVTIWNPEPAVFLVVCLFLAGLSFEEVALASSAPAWALGMLEVFLKHPRLAGDPCSQCGSSAFR